MLAIVIDCTNLLFHMVKKSHSLRWGFFLAQILDRVYTQFQAFMDDTSYKQEHGLLVRVIQTLGKIGPNAEPKFRDECEFYIIQYICFFVCVFVCLFAFL